MTPYRERREKGHYDSPTNTPASVHSHHLPGLLTGTVTVETMPFDDTASVQSVMKEISEEAAPVEDFSTFTKTELLTLAKERGLSPANAAMSKAELRAALEANQ